MNKLRKELADRVASREQDLIKYGKALREQEDDFTREKEARQSLEVSHTNMKELVQGKEVRNRDMELSLHRKVLELEEFAGMKLVFSETKRELEDSCRREKQLTAEVEQLGNRERRMYGMVEELSSKERKYIAEMDRLVERVDSLGKDGEEKDGRIETLVRDVGEGRVRVDGLEQDCSRHEKIRREYQTDTNRLLAEFGTLQGLAQDWQMQNQNLNKDLLQVKKSEEGLSIEKDLLLAKISGLTKDFTAKSKETDELRESGKQLGARLDYEVSQQTESRLQNKEKFGQVSVKITELQDTLQETQGQLMELRGNEKNMRATLRSKEELLKSQTAALAEVEAKVQELLGTGSRETAEFDMYKNRKRDEILAIQDKYAMAKQSMDAEVSQLRFTMSQKQGQYTSLVEEYNLLKSDIHEYAGGRSALEGRVAEAVANESGMARQTANLTSQLNQKTQEVSRVNTKLQSQQDHMKRLEEELAMYRDNNTSARDADISRLQNNMQEISKRLKSQVDVLLDAPTSPDVHSRTASNASSSIMGRSRFAMSPSAAAGSNLPRSAIDTNEDFDNLDRLFNRPMFKPSATDL